MEKQLNFVRNGVIRLPPGFRFHPTDEELVVQYLRRKVFACPLPASIIPEIDICKYNPWELPGNSEQERYFFSTREAKYRNGNRPNRATGSGYWKATGIDKRIIIGKGNQVVGMKKTLVFYRGKPPNGIRTDWIMHEYRLTEAGSIAPPHTKTTMEDWVLCRIFLKKRNNRNDEETMQPCKEKNNNNNNNVVENHITLTKPRFIDFMMQDKIATTAASSSSSSSSSGSSGVTEATSSESDHDENGICNSVSS